MTCGIYSITSPSGNCYIGSSINVERRRTEHFRLLKKGSHYSLRFQESFKQHAGEGFIFTIVETCSKNNLLDYEQQYLDKYTPFFNSSKIAAQPFKDLDVRANNLRAKRTQESRLKAASNSLALGRSKDLNTALSIEKRNITNRTPEARQRTREKMRSSMMPVRRLGEETIYESTCAAERATGIHNSAIRAAALTGCKAGGFTWVFCKIDIVI
jgi:group I intron endonuclease